MTSFVRPLGTGGEKSLGRAEHCCCVLCFASPPCGMTPFQGRVKDQGKLQAKMLGKQLFLSGPQTQKR